MLSPTLLQVVILYKIAGTNFSFIFQKVEPKENTLRMVGICLNYYLFLTAWFVSRGVNTAL